MPAARRHLDRLARRARRRVAVGLPLLILLAGVVCSVALAIHWECTVAARDRADFDAAVHDSSVALGSELKRTEDALRGVDGLFGASHGITRSEFRRYVRALDMPARYPSIRGIAYVSAVPTRSLAQFIAAQRRGGAPRFTVRLAPGSDPNLAGALLRRIVTYAEPNTTPLAGRPGRDVTARRPARVAQDSARDTGRAALTARIELAPHGELGVSMVLPVYRTGAPLRTVAERRAALRGWVVARVGAQRFVAGVQTAHRRRLGVELFDGARADRAALMARRNVVAAGRRAVLARAVRARVGGRTWTLRFTAVAGSRGVLADREPLTVLLAGLALSVLLAALVRTQMAARLRADREVFERTAQLRRTTAELSRSNAELESHNREVEAFARRQRDFVATASHELRTPLTSIIGYLELVLGTPPEELRDEQRSHLQIAYRAGQRLLAIVGDLLTVDRADAGAMEVRPRSTPVATLLAATADTFAPACAAKGLTLTVEPVADAVAVHVDAERMQQVLGNIVGNAVQLTPAPGEIRLAVEVAGDRAQLRISDTGPGIAPDELPHLFERFYRTDASMRAAMPGTGLGLTIARSLVEAHGGTLGVESELGAGTTFVVALPLVGAARAAA
jgi:signal transduction histidine kinase